MRSTLRDVLQDWTPVDSAAYLLAVNIGLMPNGIFATKAKHVFWSQHPVGTALYQLLDSLVAAGVLEYREEPDCEYRWSPTFRGTWA